MEHIIPTLGILAIIFLGCVVVSLAERREKRKYKERCKQAPGIRCLCSSKNAILSSPGGQYQNTWIGRCPDCGREWIVSNELKEE